MCTRGVRLTYQPCWRINHVGGDRQRSVYCALEWCTLLIAPQQLQGLEAAMTAALGLSGQTSAAWWPLCYQRLGRWAMLCGGLEERGAPMQQGCCEGRKKAGEG
jgi:hypothetical protein